MNNRTYCLIAAISLAGYFPSFAQSLYSAPPAGVHTKWVSPENADGGKGQGATINKGAKGRPFYIVAPGETKALFDQSGPGVVKRMWMSGTIARSAEQRRAVRIDMYWDGAAKPAVSAPIGDFFGLGLGLMAPFDNQLFSSPEGRSFNFTVPMPFRTSARIEITNESSSYVLFWYDISYLELPEVDEDALYFHAFWQRKQSTELGSDYEILPRVSGTGRYLGTSVGVIGHPDYNGTWFGEGELKVYLDGDTDLPTLVGTGTEDYIGSGWGQGEYVGRYFGSLISDPVNDLYSFYRYHTDDPVYFHEDIRVTIQQMGAASKEKVALMLAEGAAVQPVWVIDTKGGEDVLTLTTRPEVIRLLDMDPVPRLDTLPEGATGYYREDDVSATAYFYLDKPESDLPSLPSLDVRLKDMEEKVWSKKDN